MIRRDAVALALAACAAGCGSAGGSPSAPPHASARPPSSPAEADAGAPVDGSGPDETPAKGVEAARADRFPVEEGGLGWHAYEARPAVPSWGAPASQPEASRDDDLLTAWTCEMGSGRCALTLELDEAADVRLLRIFGARGSTHGERRGAPRVKSVRLHTGEGFVDATVRDYWDHQHVLLSKAITTRALTIEVTEVYGPDHGVVGIAEVEVFGPRGPSRGPLKLAPSRLIVRGPEGFFVGRPPGVYDAKPLWLEEIDGAGGAKRLFRGSRLHTIEGDRYALVQRVVGASCPGAYFHESSRYFLLDLHSRALVGLGAHPGPVTVWRHPSGNGFAVLRTDWAAGESDLWTVSVDGDQLVRDSFRIEDADREGLVARAKATGFEPIPVAVECSELSDLSEAEIRVAFGAALDRIDGFDATMLGACDLGGGRKLLSMRPCVCWDRWIAAVTGRDGRRLGPVIEERGGPGFVVVRSLADGTKLISVNLGSTGAIYVLTPTGELRRAYDDAVLFVGEPAGCMCEA